MRNTKGNKYAFFDIEVLLSAHKVYNLQLKGILLKRNIISYEREVDMYYTAEIERFETDKWVVVKVEDVYYYVLTSMLPQGTSKGDRVLALVTDGKVRAVTTRPRLN